jgi:hypothetical protein
MPLDPSEAQTVVVQAKSEAGRLRATWTQTASQSPEQPIPNRACEATSAGRDDALAPTAAPSAAVASSAATSRRRGTRSRATPIGSCIAAKTTLKAPPRTPSAQGSSASSAAIAGASAAGRVR